MPTNGSALGASSILALAEHVTVQFLGEAEGGVALRLDSGEMYTLNDTAIEFARRLDGAKTIGEVAGELVAIFEAEPAGLLGDLIEVADGMIGESLLVVVE